MSDVTETLAGPDLQLGTGDDVEVTYYASNYEFVAPTAFASITPKAVSVSFQVNDKVYDGTTAATLNQSTPFAFTGLVGAETLGLATASVAFDTADVAYSGQVVQPKTVQVSGYSLVDGSGLAGNYQLSNATATAQAVINVKVLSSVTGLIGINRTYDRTIDASVDVSAAVLGGVVAGDNVAAASVNATFADKDAGVGKPIAISGIHLAGADALNYAWDSSVAVSGVQATIHPKAITAINGLEAEAKFYDGTTTTLVVVGTLGFEGLIGGDDLELGPGVIGEFESANAGVGKTVFVSGLSLGGIDAANYQLTGATTATATSQIIPRPIASVTGIVVADRMYDGGTAASFDASAAVFNPHPDPQHAAFSGLVDGESLRLTGGTAQFASSDVSWDGDVVASKEVVISGYTLANGAGGSGLASNYQLFNDPDSGADSTQSVASAKILPREITSVTGLVANNKVYDGTDAATLDVSGAIFSGAIAGDVLTLDSATGHFDDKNAGSGKAVTLVSAAFDSPNYVLSGTVSFNTMSANIAKASITGVSGILSQGKNYDGTTAVVLDGGAAVFAGLVGGDSLTVASVSGHFVDANAGVEKPVLVTAVTLGGPDVANYELAASATLVAVGADIAQREITTVSGLAAFNKTYDGTVTATLDFANASLPDVLAGDIVFVTDAAGQFAAADVGTAVSVTATSVALGGPQAGNYRLAADFSTNALAADVNKRVITSVSGLVVDVRDYDGTTAATVNTSAIGFIGVVADDLGSLSIAYSAAEFASKDAGGHPVTITGIAVAGAASANYELAAELASVSVPGTIRPKSVTVSFTAVDRDYDGSAEVDLSTPAFTGMVDGETLNLTAAVGAFADKNAGVGKTVTVGGYSLADGTLGELASNYVLQNSTATTTATISPRVVAGIGGIIAADKDYDGTTAADLDLSGVTFGNLLGGDDLALTAADGAFASKDVSANPQAVAVRNVVLGGADAGNYLVTGATVIDPVTATISPRAVTVVGFSAEGKVYDGTTAAVVDDTNLRVGGVAANELLGLSGGVATFDSANAGSRTVTFTGYSLVDGAAALASNYVLAAGATSVDASATISPKSVTASFTVADKQYDQSTAADITDSALDGVLAGETLLLEGASAWFADNNANAEKTVTVTGYSLADGTGLAANYVLASAQASTTATITAKPITVTGVVVVDKEYDGSTTATVDSSSVDWAAVGVLPGDAIGLSASTTFPSSHAVGVQTLPLSSTYSGADAGNYDITDQVSATATINAKTVTISGFTVSDRVYDGTTAVLVDPAGLIVNGLVQGEALTVSGGAAALDSPNAGSRTVTFSGFSLADGGNGLGGRLCAGCELPDAYDSSFNHPEAGHSQFRHRRQRVRSDHNGNDHGERTGRARWQ